MNKTIAMLVALVLLCALTLSTSAQTAVDVILSARTTQAFKANPVSEADLNTILEAGLASVSAINQQPWHFAVITNQDVMKDIGGSGMPMGGAPAGAPPSQSSST